MDISEAKVQMLLVSRKYMSLSATIYHHVENNFKLRTLDEMMMMMRMWLSLQISAAVLFIDRSE
jgi:hypothetical protein